MLLAAKSSKAEEIFPEAYNKYIENLFMGYPEIINSWCIATTGDKMEGAKELYKNVFGEDPIGL